MAVEIFVGNAAARLRALASNSVHCVVTSPPYWGLRDYKLAPQIWGGEPQCRHRWGDEKRYSTGRNDADRLTDGLAGGHGGGTTTPKQQATNGAFCTRCGAWRGCLGLEPDYLLYVDHLVEILREIRRVLRPDGTLWLNLGDCYATGAGKAKKAGGGDQGLRWQGPRAQVPDGKNPHAGVSTFQPNRIPQRGLKPKDLVLLPARIAIALQDDGWWVRSDTIWSKPNPMPESVIDRPTRAHEYLFLLTKSARYYYDREAVKEACSEDSARRAAAGRARGGRKIDAGRRDSDSATLRPLKMAAAARNKRSVWTITAAPFKGAHFATFPPKLVEPCILAGTSARGVCPHCGAPWVRVTKVDYRKNCPSAGNDPRSRGEDRQAEIHTHGWQGNNLLRETETIGWRPGCACAAGAPVPATVLDPFGGAGTTGLVAARLGRAAVLLELNPEYAAIAAARISAGGHTIAVAAEQQWPRTGITKAAIGKSSAAPRSSATATAAL